MKKNGIKILTFIVLLVGILIRVLFIGTYPVGLNQDEASIAYEALSLAKYGVDRFGNIFPVHFIAWGSGQNALYAYLLIPIFKGLGVSTTTIRLPMALLGSISLIMVYILAKNLLQDPKKILIMVFLFAIFPWHILKSRWALESNLFPDLILIASILLYLSIKKNITLLGILASIIFGISVYSYGTSYLFLPIYLLLTYIILIKNKYLTFKKSISYLSITTIISIPMIIFVIINYFDLNTITIFNITIPKLYYNRFTSITSVNGNILTNCITNLLKTIKIIILQKDNQILNYTKYFGIYYLFSLPIIILGIIKSFKNKDTFNIIISTLFISSIILSLFVSPNINRINILWISLFFYLVYGIIYVYNNYKLLFKILITLYISSFMVFIIYYFTSYQDLIENKMNYSLEKIIDYSTTLDYDKLYIDISVNQPYIYYLLYTEMNVYYYIDNVSIKDYNVMFQEVISIDNIYFTSFDSLEKNNAYIIDIDNLSRYDTTNYNTKCTKYYCIIY